MPLSCDDDVSSPTNRQKQVANVFGHIKYRLTVNSFYSRHEYSTFHTTYSYSVHEQHTMEAGEATTQLPVNVGCENMKDIDVDSKESKNSTHELVPLKGDEHGDNTPDAVPRLDSRHAEPAFVGDIDSTVQQETADYGRFEGVEIKQDSIRSISSSTFSDICVDDLDEKFEDMSVKNDDISTTPFKALDETAREVRSHAYDLLQRLSTGLVRETNHDSGKPRNHHDDGAASAGHDNKRMILRVGLIISFLVVALIVVIIFLTLSNKNEPQFDSSNDTATESPTRAPLVFQSNCQSVADLMEQPGVLVWEAENSIYFSDTVNVSSTESGYCGGGYATGFTKEGSRFVPGHLDIPSSGYYSISLRYSNNAPMDQEIILSVDSAVGAFFVLRPTQNEWAVESVQDVLMNEGSRYVEVWTRIAHTPNGPNIDWVAMELQGKPLNRSEFLVASLGLADDSMPSQSSALIWMAESDPMDWSSLSNRQIKERFVLVEIFHATYGELWSKDNDNWLTEAHICDWYGVVCNSRNLVTDLLLGE